MESQWVKALWVEELWVEVLWAEELWVEALWVEALWSKALCVVYKASHTRTNGNTVLKQIYWSTTSVKPIQKQHKTKTVRNIQILAVGIKL
jgi:hypothetical protein